MILSFRPTMDPHSLEIYRDDKFVGDLQWHDRMIFFPWVHVALSVEEMRAIVAKADEIEGQR